MGQLYTPFKIFHYPEKLGSLTRSAGKMTPPLHIRIKPTNVCNHRCSYCAYRAEGLQLGQDMNLRDLIPREKMLEIIADLVEMDVKAVTFSGGGEPLCYPHITETLGALEKTSIKFATLTNGALLTGEPAEILARSGTWVRVSMDGWDDASYTHYRGAPAGEYTKILGNMERFMALNGKCILGVSLIVDQDNAAHVYESVRRLQEVGVHSVKISPCITSNKGSENNSYHAPIFETVRGEVEQCMELAGDDFEIFDAYHVLDEKFSKKYKWCPYQQILPIIGADQNIYPCQDKAYNLEEGLLGSIKDQRFKDFWFARRETFFKIDPSKHCDHHCVANGKNQLILEFLDADKEHLGFV